MAGEWLEDIHPGELEWRSHTTVRDQSGNDVHADSWETMGNVGTGCGSVLKETKWNSQHGQGSADAE